MNLIDQIELLRKLGDVNHDGSFANECVEAARILTEKTVELKSDDPVLRKRSERFRSRLARRSATLVEEYPQFYSDGAEYESVEEMLEGCRKVMRLVIELYRQERAH